MNLILDLGNSVQKLAVFDNDNIIFLESKGKLGVGFVQSVFEKFQINASIIATVAQYDAELESILLQRKNGLTLSPLTPVPIINKYSTPQTLGNDRLASAVGSNWLWPGKNVLSIDAGTCIKYDFINSENEYCGGAISPGLSMRLKAMHNFTARLPLINPLSLTNYTPVNLIGDSTNLSMLSGTYNGALSEVEGMIDKYSSQYSNLTVVITGGDGHFFELHVKRQIFARPNLVLEGLNRILNFNLNKN